MGLLSIWDDYWRKNEPQEDGTFGSYELKPKYGVDYHIVTSAIGFVEWNNVDYSQGFKILGVVSANNYVVNLNIDELTPLPNFLQSIDLASIV